MVMKRLFTTKLFAFVTPVILMCGTLFVVGGCASDAEEEPLVEEEPAVVEEEPEIEPQPVEDPEIKPEPEPEPEPEIEVEPEPAEGPEPEIEDDPQEEDFVVSEEIYTQTFTDVEELIKRLNRIIGSSDFDRWLNYCTEDYKDYYSDSETLRELSNRPTLQKYNIRLTSLKDYFTYVVVPSRSNARLDDLVFEDNNRVKAIMIIDGQRVILYQMEKVDGQWKIGI